MPPVAYWVGILNCFQTVFYETPYWTVLVERKDLEENRLPNQLFTSQDRRWMKKELRAEFVGEGNQGRGIIDHGGGKKVMFGEALKASFNCMEVWDKVEDGDYYDFKKGARLLKVKQVGLVVGLAFLNNVVIPFPLPEFFFLKLKDHKSEWPDCVDNLLAALKSTNRHLASSLQSFWEEPDQVKDEDEMWYWTVVVKEEGRVVEVPVCPGGASKLLKRKDVRYYVKTALLFLLYEYKKAEFEAFAEGFYLVAGPALFHLVEAKDLKLCISGVAEIDWHLMKKKAMYEAPYAEHHPLIIALWEFVFTLDRADSQRLLGLW